MSGPSNRPNAANIYEKDLLQIEEIFSLYFNCLNDKGWDKYLVKTLELNTNKFSEFLKKEKDDDNRGVNTEYEKLLNFLENNVFEKFEEKVPSQFSKKEVFKLLLCAIFQSNIEEIDHYEGTFLYNDMKAELNSYIRELKKSMEELEPVREVNDGGDETKDEDDEPNTSDGQSSELNKKLNQTKDQLKDMRKQKLNEDERKRGLIELLSRFIDVENEIITPPISRWRQGQTYINPRSGEDFFLRHMGYGILNINGDDTNAIINQMETAIDENRQEDESHTSRQPRGQNPDTTSSQRQDTRNKIKEKVETLYKDKETEFETLETNVFNTARDYIIKLLNNLDAALNAETFEPKKKRFITTMKNQLISLKFKPLQCFGEEPNNAVYTRSYKTTLLRKVVEILSQAFQSAGFLISEKIVKLIKNMRGSGEVLDIKQDPLILRLLYKSYLYVSSSVREMDNEIREAQITEEDEHAQQSLSELICEKYQINDDFRDIIKDKGGNDEGKKIKMAIAFAFNNNIYF